MILMQVGEELPILESHTSTG